MVFKIYVLLSLLASLFIWQFIHQKLFLWLGHKIKGQRLFLVDKLSYYTGFIILIMVALKLTGAHLSDLLATAGVVTVAIGFAAKTSVSHFISGFILLGTKLIKKGDIIEVGQFMGVIENIDIFSTHLRTFDNILISLPNEKLLTEYVSNYSNYPIRRLSCEWIIKVEDLSDTLVENLEQLIAGLPLVLVEPAPLIMITSEPGKGIKLGMRAWCESTQYVKARNQVIIAVSKHLKENHVLCYSELALYSQAH